MRIESSPLVSPMNAKKMLFHSGSISNGILKSVVFASFHGMSPYSGKM